MTCLQGIPTTDDVSVGMGHTVLARAPTRLNTILGSCVAVTLYAKRHKTGMLSHIVLPRSRGASDLPGKFADTAIPYMLSTLADQGIMPRELLAKVVGGACMFGAGQFAQIGQSNVQETMRSLQAAGIAIAGCDVNGSNGRRICFDLATGCITIASVGRSKKTI